GEKPEGALFKEGEDVPVNPHFSEPTNPEAAPGVTEPGDPANRNMR
ncbi:ubiquinol oxidase subunit II, partial [Enterococcus faecium]